MQSAEGGRLCFDCAFAMLYGMFLLVDEQRQLAAAGMDPVSVGVTNLRCEYLKEPLGLDVANPRWSWELLTMRAGARGQRQAGYQVLVASSVGSPDALEKLPAGEPVDNLQPDPWFRKTVELPAVPTRALIYIASVGYVAKVCIRLFPAVT